MTRHNLKIDIWQASRREGERPLPFIICLKEKHYARWFALSLINNEPPPLNSALMSIIKSSRLGIRLGLLWTRSPPLSDAERLAVQLMSG